MDLTIRTTQILGQVEIWASAQRRFLTGGVTLDSSLFSADDDGNKYVPAGTVIGRVAATGKWGPAVAPVAATLTAHGVTVTANEAGTAGNGIKVALVDPSANSQALAVSVAADTISVSLATDGTGAITSTAADIVAAINAHLVARTLVTASGDATDAVAAVAATALAGGAAENAGGEASDRYALLAVEANVTNGDVGTSAVDMARVIAARCPTASAGLRALVPGITWA